MASMRQWMSALLLGGIALASHGALAADQPGAADRVTLGVQINDTPGCPGAVGQTGACLLGVRAGGAADRAGLRAGDVILRFADRDIAVPQDLPAALREVRAGQSVEISYQRAGAKGQAHVQFATSDLASANPGATAPQQLPGRYEDPCEATRTGRMLLPYQKLPAMDATETAALLGERTSAVELRGNVLTLVLRAPGRSASVLGSIQCRLDRVGDSDLWALQLRMDQWMQSFLSADFMAFEGEANDLLVAAGPPTRTAQSVFRGPAAPPAPASSQPLRGSLVGAMVPSRFLGSPKQVSVYLPPQRGAGALPVLYMTDGQGLPPFAAVAEALILSGKVRPFAIVAEHAGRFDGDSGRSYDPSKDNRAREYLPVMDPPQFALHMRFFVEELIPWAEKTYALSNARADRAAMGYSNGAAFVDALGVQHPEAIATVLPFSPAHRVSFNGELQGGYSHLPRFLFAGGELESPFLTSARVDADWLKARGVSVQLRSYWSGHDTLLWQRALADYLPEVFGAR